MPTHNPAQHQDLVRRLTESILGDARTRHLSTVYLPSRREIVDILEHLTWLMFPGFIGPRDLTAEAMSAHVSAVLKEVVPRLVTQTTGALQYQEAVETSESEACDELAECERRAREIVSIFLQKLPDVRRLLSLDAQAAYDGDPAAHHTDEIIFSYPGVRALTVHRLSHELYKLKVPLLPRIMSEHAHSITGIDIHPGARVGQSFFIDHGTGVVIGETAVIGDHCAVYQGVTLGAKGFPKDEQGKYIRDVQRHPTLEDHVTVYAGATILGGDTVIGAGSVVNGGVFLTHSVPPGHVVRGPIPDLTLRKNKEMPPLSWSI